LRAKGIPDGSIGLLVEKAHARGKAKLADERGESMALEGDWIGHCDCVL
jgi:hypothetical protein